MFNTFPYTSFSQNVGLVGVTGVKSRWVCVAGGIIMIVLGMLPKMAAFVESIPTFVLGGAGLVMFGMVAATGIRILSTVDYRNNRNNLYVVALSIGFGLIPLVAPRWMQQMAHGLHPAARVRHPADLDRGRRPEPLLQRREGRHCRGRRGRQGCRGALSTLLIRHATLLVTMDAQRREIPDGAVFVRDNVIEQVGATATLPVAADEVIDARDRSLCPAW